MNTGAEPVKREVTDEVREFLHAEPKPEFVDAFIVDVNGIARGKRLPIKDLERAYTHGVSLPASTALLDVRGEDVEATGLVSDTGDRDALCWPVAGSLRPLPFSPRPAGQLLLHMHNSSGELFAGDPRTPLTRAVEGLRKRGLTAVIACELEFRLLAPELDSRGYPVIPSMCSKPGARSQTLGFEKLEDELDSLLVEIRTACIAQGIPMDTVSVEQGEGMYEINLMHVADPLLAADHAFLLKRTIKACARRHHLAATFMAKPFGTTAGNGLHVHVSVLDEGGSNVFNDAGEPSERLLQAVAGLLDTMPDSTAIFAPHANSYRRFQMASHVPMAMTWGIDNRTTALRLPLAEPAATRIEHRVSGADANPYLVLSVILAGIERGMAKAMSPPPPTEGNAYIQKAATLPDAWGEALTRFERSPFIADCLGTDYRAWYTAVKRQEREGLRQIVPPSEYDLYLQTV